MSSITIQINDLSGVKHLLGDETEVSLEIRKSVKIALISEYVRRKNHPIGEAIALACEQGVESLIKCAEYKYNGSHVQYAGSRATFSPSRELQDSVKNMVADEMAKVIRAEISSQWAALQPTLATHIEQGFAKAVETYVGNAVKAGLDKLENVKSALKEILK